MSKLLIEFEHPSVLIEVEPCRLCCRMTLPVTQGIPSSSRTFHFDTCSLEIFPRGLISLRRGCGLRICYPPLVPALESMCEDFGSRIPFFCFVRAAWTVASSRLWSDDGGSPIASREIRRRSGRSLRSCSRRELARDRAVRARGWRTRFVGGTRSGGRGAADRDCFRMGTRSRCGRLHRWFIAATRGGCAARAASLRFFRSSQHFHSRTDCTYQQSPRLSRAARSRCLRRDGYRSARASGRGARMWELERIARIGGRARGGFPPGRTGGRITPPEDAVSNRFALGC